MAEAKRGDLRGDLRILVFDVDIDVTGQRSALLNIESEVLYLDPRQHQRALIERIYARVLDRSDAAALVGNGGPKPLESARVVLRTCDYPGVNVHAWACGVLWGLAQGVNPAWSADLHSGFQFVVGPCPVGARGTVQFILHLREVV